MENPFVYGKEVFGDNFCNRKNEINELCRDVVNSQSVIVFSQRRLGKTSLIKEVFRSCKNKGIITIYVDLYAALDEEDFVTIYAKAVAETVFGNIQKKFKELAKFFRKIRPTFSMDQLGQMSYTMNIDNKELIPALEDVLDSVKRYADKRNKKVAVCFDEFQQIGQFKTDKIEKIMRSSFQKHHNIAYIFMGSKKHLITDMFNNPNRPFYRSAKPFPLGKINTDELILFIKNKFQKTKKSIDDDIINEIIDVSESHPYYIQYICHIIWEKALDERNAKRAAFIKSLDLLLKRESSAYEATWDLLTVKQKQALIALAKALPGDKLFSAEFLQKHNLGSASTLQRTLRSLVDKDLIDKEKGVYSIIDVFFKKWISLL